jgi:hypothetical protein
MALHNSFERSGTLLCRGVRIQGRIGPGDPSRETEACTLIERADSPSANISHQSCSLFGRESLLLQRAENKEMYNAIKFESRDRHTLTMDSETNNNKHYLCDSKVTTCAALSQSTSMQIMP